MPSILVGQTGFRGARIDHAHLSVDLDGDPRRIELGLHCWRSAGRDADKDRQSSVDQMEPQGFIPPFWNLVSDQHSILWLPGRTGAAGSLVQGTVRASELIRALQRGGRPSSLARAISEIGRIAKTLHLLAYIDDEAYRRRILQQINRGEGRHSVARAVFFGKRGELRRRYKEGQEDQLGALGLVVNLFSCNALCQIEGV